MKNALKHLLLRHGLLPWLDLLRRLPEIVRWVRSGCRGVAPAPIKRLVLATYLRAHGLKRFVESGTHLGDTLAYVARDPSVHAISVELQEAYFDAARQRFAKYGNVRLLHGVWSLSTLSSDRPRWLMGGRPLRLA